MFGSHLSIAGSMINAVREAEALRLDTVQVFTKNQQQWSAKPLKPEQVQSWRAETMRLGWADRTVVHASYLANLASPDDALWAKSVGLMQEEIERCETLAIPYLVHHPGAWTTSTLEAGLERIGRAYAELFTRTKGCRTVCCLENTAGAGTTIGRRFEELARLRELIVERTGAERRVGYCIDTCHAFAAGYDLSTPDGAAAVLDEIDRVLGFENVRVVHLNDSQGALGSRLDRHEHIGRGRIGEAGFGVVVRDARLAKIPKILETPKGSSPEGEPWDTVNLRVLSRLAGEAAVVKPSSSGRQARAAPRAGSGKKAAGARSGRARRA